MNQFKAVFLHNKLFFKLFLIWLFIGLILFFTIGDTKIFFFVNSRHSIIFDYVNTVFSLFGRGDFIAIVLLLLLFVKELRTREYLYSSLVFGITIPVLIYLMKDFFNRERPLSIWTHEQIHTVPWLENLYNNSFPSGHTFGAFGFFFILNHFIAGNKKLVTCIYFILALSCGYSRMYLGQHHFTDILAGSVGGIIFSYCIISIVHKIVNKKS